MVKTILKEKADRSDELFRKEFFCESEEDTAVLPTQTDPRDDEKCATGSLAYVLSPDSGKSRLRILTSEGTWKEVGV